MFDGSLRIRRLADSVENNLSFLPGAQSGGVFGGGRLQDDGLAALAFESNPVARGESGGSFEALFIFYGFGGIDSGESGGYFAFNQLYAQSFASGGSGGGWQYIEKYTPGPEGSPVFGGAALTGLAFLPTQVVLPRDARGTMQAPVSGLLWGITSLGFDRLGNNFFASGSQVVDVQFDFNIGTPNDLVPQADFMVPLEGALAASAERGSLFMVANLPDLGLLSGTTARGGFAFERAIIEFDPRANYIKNGWWQGDLAHAAGTVIDPSFASGGHSVFTLGQYAFPVKGAAFVGGRLILTAQAPASGAFINQYFTFDPDAAGTAADPHVKRIEASPGIKTALAEAINAAVALPAMPMLTPDSLTAGEMRLAAVNELFSTIAYSQAALDSGVARRVFEKHFLETSLDPAMCRESMLFTADVPVRLSANVDRQNGFGRTAFQLREGLTTAHSCATPANAMPSGGRHADSHGAAGH